MGRGQPRLLHVRLARNERLRKRTGKALPNAAVESQTHGQARASLHRAPLSQAQQLVAGAARGGQGRADRRFTDRMSAETKRANQLRLYLSAAAYVLFMNDSHAALSHGFPLRDMLMVMPCSFSKSV